MLEPGEFSIHDDRWLTYPWGVNGGLPGMRSTKRLVRSSGVEENIPSKCDRIQVEPGDILYFDTWGGGGWGNPLERDAQLVVADVARKLVSEQGARRYGVVVNNGQLDVAATDRLRTQMAANSAGPALFDRGFESIEELKQRCEAETGFPPPVAPVFRQQYEKAAS